MEERDPSLATRSHNPHPDVVAPEGENHDDSSPETSKQQPFRSGTYIIQVPKDQIYRVPPAENALLAERLRAPERRRTCCCHPICLWILGIVIIVAVILGAVGGIASSMLKHDNPTFSVEGVLVKNRSPDGDKKRPEYDITLKAGNQNRHVKIEYQEGSDASLFFKQKKIAAGKFPGFDQDSKTSTDVKIFLRGTNIALPKEISRSINGTNSKKSISLLFSGNVPLKSKAFFTSESKKIQISCSFSADSLVKNTRILTQKCETTG